MIDLKANTCPNREQRAGAINAYYASERTWCESCGRDHPEQEREFQQSSAAS